MSKRRVEVKLIFIFKSLRFKISYLIISALILDESFYDWYRWYVQQASTERFQEKGKTCVCFTKTYGDSVITRDNVFFHFNFL